MTRYKVYEDKNGSGVTRYIDTVETDMPWKAIETAYTENAQLMPDLVKADLYTKADDEDL